MPKTLFDVIQRYIGITLTKSRFKELRNSNDPADAKAFDDFLEEMRKQGIKDYYCLANGDEE